jgi:hypothetical protein
MINRSGSQDHALDASKTCDVIQISSNRKAYFEIDPRGQKFDLRRVCGVVTPEFFAGFENLYYVLPLSNRISLDG